MDQNLSQSFFFEALGSMEEIGVKAGQSLTGVLLPLSCYVELQPRQSRRKQKHKATDFRDIEEHFHHHGMKSLLFCVQFDIILVFIASLGR